MEQKKSLCQHNINFVDIMIFKIIIYSKEGDIISASNNAIDSETLIHYLTENPGKY